MYIRKGDKVTLKELRVICVYKDGDVSVGIGSNGIAVIPQKIIASVNNRIFDVGDIVKNVTGRKYRILSIVDGAAWLRAYELRHAEPGAPEEYIDAVGNLTPAD